MIQPPTLNVAGNSVMHLTAHWFAGKVLAQLHVADGIYQPMWCPQINIWSHHGGRHCVRGREGKLNGRQLPCLMSPLSFPNIFNPGHGWWWNNASCHRYRTYLNTFVIFGASVLVYLLSISFSILHFLFICFYSLFLPSSVCTLSRLSFFLLFSSISQFFYYYFTSHY